MTKINVFRYSIAVISIGSLLLCFCANLGDSTDLGSGIINTVEPGKTDIDKYFQGFLLDSTLVKERFSIPDSGDSGFGYHNVSSGNMLIGKANNEHSVGYIEIIILRDTIASTRFFVNNDTLKFLKLVFSGSFPVASQFDIFSVSSKKNALAYDSAQKLGTISFTGRGDTVQTSSVEIYDSLKAGSFNRLFGDSIFRACSTWTKEGAKMSDTLRFSVVYSGETVVQLQGACSMVMSARRPVDSTKKPIDTALQVKAYPSSQSWYLVAEDEGIMQTRTDNPVSSFASKRTAVYKYRVDSLWPAMGANGLLLTAGFLITNPTSDSLLTISYILRPDIVHDGVLLDSVFAVGSGALSVLKGTALVASVAGPLQKMYTDGSKPAYVYLYVRYGNTTSEWKTVTMDMKPAFKAMITTP